MEGEDETVQNVLGVIKVKNDGQIILNLHHSYEQLSNYN
jgi:hypothetical protein